MKQRGDSSTVDGGVPWKTLGHTLVAGVLCGTIAVLVDMDHLLWYLFQGAFPFGRFLHAPLLYAACAVLAVYLVSFAGLFIRARWTPRPRKVRASASGSQMGNHERVYGHPVVAR
ncbi:MAG: hypothetical protein SVP26_03515 [Chloroflexota bacterium]|nr:hypothetical protein [Chloroflexota bacterium]